MEQILNNYDKFVEFVDGHEQVLEKEDYNLIYNKSKNIDVKRYLMESGNIEIDDDQYITTLTNPKFKSKLIEIIESGKSINIKKDNKTLLDFVILKYIDNLTEDEFKDEIEYFYYILFIIEKGGIPNLNIMKENINKIMGMNSGNLNKILMLIDVLIIKGAEKVSINKTNEIEMLLFKNLEKGINNIELSNKLKSRLNMVSEEGSESNKVIVKDYVVYEDRGGTHWIFNRKLFEKIKKTNRNPYTNDIINESDLKDLEKKLSKIE